MEVMEVMAVRKQSSPVGRTSPRVRPHIPQSRRHHVPRTLSTVFIMSKPRAAQRIRQMWVLRVLNSLCLGPPASKGKTGVPTSQRWREDAVRHREVPGQPRLA